MTDIITDADTLACAERAELERMVVQIIEDEVGIGYEPNLDGTTDPRSLRLFGHGAAIVIVHELITRLQRSKDRLL